MIVLSKTKAEQFRSESLKLQKQIRVWQKTVIQLTFSSWAENAPPDFC